MDMRYWAEKVEASDKADGIREWSPERFRAAVREAFEDRTDDEDWSQVRKDGLWSEIEQQVLWAANDGEHRAMVALHDFEFDGFRFTDWEDDCREWSGRFVWCCYALEWAIVVYDASTVKTQEVA
jgi:hypothetical protein